MITRNKRWGRLGLGVLAGTALLAACGGEGGEAGEVGEAGEAGHDVAGIHGEAGEGGEGEGGEGEGGEAGHSAASLPVENRVAFMSGHVAAGLALFRAGAPAQAAPHLLHPVSETHASERAGIDALGFDQSVFIAVSEALEAGRPAEEIAPQLVAAEANMALVRANAGGDDAQIIAYLMDTVFEEYRVGVTNGDITDPGEYQDAYGFAVIALDIAQGMSGPGTALLVADLEALVAMWPEAGPLADSVPAPVSELVAQTSRVHLALGEL